MGFRATGGSRALKLEPEPIGELLSCLPNGALLDLHDEVEDVSTAAFAEAVEYVLIDVDVEARPVPAAVNRARSDESTRLLLLKRREKAVSREHIPD